MLIDLQCLVACASVDGRNLAPIDVIYVTINKD